MPQYLGLGLYRYSIFQANGNCKGMPCNMIGQFLLDTANISQLLQISIGLLVWKAYERFCLTDYD